MDAKLRQIPGYSALALLIYMPFHVFVSQWLSTFTGGLELWKGAKDFVTFLLLFVCMALVTIYVKKVPRLYWYIVGGGLAYGALHVLLYVLNRNTTLEVAGLATAYNCRLFAYAVIGYSAVLLTPDLVSYRRLTKTLLMVSSIVCVIGLLQYVLPKDLMTHFGYSVARGVKPAFFIDDKPDLPRVMSTLRDPNSLAAFLIVPLTLIWSVLIRTKNKDKRTMSIGLLCLHLLTLWLTFSRAGFVGAALSLLLVTVFTQKTWLVSVWRRFWPFAVAAFVLMFISVFALRNQYVVQNVLLHSDENTKQVGSTTLHAQQIQKGLDGIADNPVGHGPGTAGLVSTKNPDGGLLPENYYVQIGYELGIVGLLLFAALSIYGYYYLMQSDHSLTAVLLASFWAYVFVNMLLQIWSNEAVAVQWWLLAGVALASLRNSHNKKSKRKLV